MMLIDRLGERDSIDELLAGVRAGRAGVLVVLGEAGVGKTALVEQVIRSGSGFNVARALSTESETELAFAGLHQLCVPFLDRLDRLPAPQRDALEAAFGIVSGQAPSAS
jgi:hypothetical protein